MISSSMLAAVALALAFAVGSASERFTGMVVNDVQMASSRGPLPERARELVDVRTGDLGGMPGIIGWMGKAQND